MENTNTHICIIGTAPWTPSIEGCVSLHIHLRAAPNPGDQVGSPEGRPVAGTSMGTTVVEPPAGRARPLRHPPHESRFRPMPSETEPPAGWMVVTGTGGPLGPREKLKREEMGIPLPLFMKKLWRKKCKKGFYDSSAVDPFELAHIVSFPPACFRLSFALAKLLRTGPGLQ